MYVMFDIKFVNIISFDNLGINIIYYILILYIKWYIEVI